MVRSTSLHHGPRPSPQELAFHWPNKLWGAIAGAEWLQKKESLSRCTCRCSVAKVRSGQSQTYKAMRGGGDLVLYSLTSRHAAQPETVYRHKSR